MTASTTKNLGEEGPRKGEADGFPTAPPLPVRTRGKGEGLKPSSISLATSTEDHHVARMAALALGLSVLEAAIPSPLPGVKPGLANIVTLIVLARYGWRMAAWVTLLRVLAGGLLLGNFLAPGFFLSLGGAVCSLSALAASQHLPQRWFGPVSHSILAAFAHIAGQLLVVFLWLIPHAGLAYLVPIFAAAALLFGTVNGLIAAHFLNPDARKPNGHGKVATPENETHHARFPHPNPPPESEKLLAGHPGEGANASLRKFHVN